MDARTIYSAMNSIKHKIEWENSLSTEWIYIGIGNEVKKGIVYQKVTELFGDDKLLLVLDRHDSRQIEEIDFQVEIIDNIGKANFFICNEKFTKFLEFNKVGTLRIGKINKTK